MENGTATPPASPPVRVTVSSRVLPSTAVTAEVVKRSVPPASLSVTITEILDLPSVAPPVGLVSCTKARSLRTSGSVLRASAIVRDVWPGPKTTMPV